MTEEAKPPAWAAKTMTAADLAYFCLNHITFSQAFCEVEYLAGQLAEELGLSDQESGEFMSVALSSKSHEAEDACGANPALTALMRGHFPSRAFIEEQEDKRRRRQSIIDGLTAPGDERAPDELQP
ncbi:hypothetical protein [Bradyrhizobium erythrophlei]|uniref:Uncharacterized protein n=1 Tax=Bradyrhizobium erythrophlei TaxID=1437360 RepID=A0A1M5XVL3_9BRAD|nr:hypothetical protein [Bradyrhizobium erythrophlei]SHI03885.1 hypothetical protein SAMN05443248_7666 [Bradyrhizobium erythrophlei]